MLVEDVPSFQQRVGDYVVQGSNNALIVLGRDRGASGRADVDSGHGAEPRSGAILAVVGRSGQDPDFSSDSAYVYLSMRSDADRVVGTVRAEGDTGESSAFLAKADAVRVVARKDAKLFVDGSYVFVSKDRAVVRVGSSVVTVSDGKAVVESGRIELGAGASEPMVLGSSFSRLWDSHVHPTPAGPSGVPTERIGPTHLSGLSFSK